MTREIRFRAWCGKMIDNETCIEEGLNPISTIGYNNQDIVWLQYTGLLDKNGKEVYEGDYLRDDDSEPVLHRIVWNEDDARFDVEWWEGETDWDTHDESWQGVGVIVEALEVIGNIYENSDLLK